ncbi:MAG: PQQ-dependent sugar dehydrogenase [Spirochaetales bacterium]|nr:PQQ-dependent sugar dehydrogenase [Spirochaetales bacterium]
MTYINDRTTETEASAVPRPNARRADRRTTHGSRGAPILAFCLIVSVGAPALLDARPRMTNTVLDTISSDQASFRLVRAVEGLDEPWSFAFLPDGDVLVTERRGTLWRVGPQSTDEVTGTPRVVASGQGGLLDIALHPAFASNRLVYLSFSDRYQGGLGTAVARARLDGAALQDMEVIFRMNRSTSGGRHFGSRLIFGTDGMLYITIGDRGTPNRSQDREDHAGTVIRIAADGSIPEDNPFVGRSDAAPEVYSYGHRNAQGIALHPETGEIWLHEHGPQGGDEINIVAAGNNYGWPVITYGVNYGSGTPIGEGTSRPGMEQPVLHWSPSIAPSGMAFYSGNSFPEWRGDIFVGALRGQHLRRLELDGDEVVGQELLLLGTVGRIRDVRQGPDGSLYLITDESDGGLYRLEPAR